MRGIFRTAAAGVADMSLDLGQDNGMQQQQTLNASRLAHTITSGITQRTQAHMTDRLRNLLAYLGSRNTQSIDSASSAVPSSTHGSVGGDFGDVSGDVPGHGAPQQHENPAADWDLIFRTQRVEDQLHTFFQDLVAHGHVKQYFDTRGGSSVPRTVNMNDYKEWQNEEIIHLFPPVDIFMSLSLEDCLYDSAQAHVQLPVAYAQAMFSVCVSVYNSVTGDHKTKTAPSIRKNTKTWVIDRICHDLLSKLIDYKCGHELKAANFRGKLPDPIPGVT